VFIWLYLKYWYSARTLNAFALIVSGAIANLLDGFSDGKVVDFIDIGASTLNFADFAIMVGIALIALQAIKIPNP
jgi:lipoprotein signal peptidase